jgi:GH25 family lysozyme M1 (1,4-beta-N-acetylmuramidase)
MTIRPTARSRSLLLHVVAWIALACVALTTRVALADVIAPPPPDAVGAGIADDPAAAPAPVTTAPVAAPPNTLPGIDVSHYQGAIDWAQVSASGVRFAIAKATEGRTYVDPMYAANRAAATANGIVFGAYHFARPDRSAGDAVAEADHFVEAADPLPHDLVPVLDVERTGDLRPGRLTRWILAWLDRVTERIGVRPMIYTSPHGWAVRTGDTTAVAEAGYTVLWVAHWGVTAPVVPAFDWGGNGWTLWQYASDGSVPGVGGHVDVDAFAGTTLDPVTIPTPDIVPPVASIDAPVGGPVTVRFDEVVRNVTPRNTYVWTPASGTYPRVMLACRTRAGTPTDCVTGDVRSATIDTVEPLVPGETYEAVVNPSVVSTAIRDRSGNLASTATATFPAATTVAATDRAVRGAWPTVERPDAVGGAYAVERSPGASASFAFTGPSVTWYTATGPSAGRAAVSIDGTRVGAFDLGASRTTWAVPHRFTGLEPGRHVITIEALPSPDPDARVVVDAFGVQGTVARNPHLVAAWASSRRTVRSDMAGASLALTFRGTGVDWVSVRGPNQGRAAILVDGERVRSVDGYAPAREPGVVERVSDLEPGVHTVRIEVLGTSRRAADGAFVSATRFTVAP